jgi:hypothetical protein
LNGWRRFWIVIAGVWALIIFGLAELEYQAGQGQTGDGFFTCWEPTGSPTPPATRYWNRDCGIFPRAWVATGFFDDLGPGKRYLNVARFSSILLGPGLFIGLVVTVVGWVLMGFREPRPRPPPPNPKNIRQASTSTDLSQNSGESAARTWLDQLPRRWARNDAIGGGLLAALPTFPLLSKEDGVFVAFMLTGFGAVTLGAAGTGYLCGLWARYSLKGPFTLNPASALGRITSNWLTGAILLAAVLLASDVLFGWRKSTPLFESGISFRDWGYVTGFFGTWMFSGYLIALVSKSGLRQAVDADRKAASPRAIAVPASDGTSRQREYSVG